MGHRVFISGVTGYLGHALVPLLRRQGAEVRAVARPGSSLPEGCNAITGNALQSATFKAHVQGCDTYIHLTGARHPAPWKGTEFEAIDWVSLVASLDAIEGSSVRHFVYVSVAHPAPVMKDYIAVRMRGERAIREAGISATILRPWYVVGPGHRWPVVLLPFYRLMELIPATRQGALRLGLVTLADMAFALDRAVAGTPAGISIIEVGDIRKIRREADRDMAATNYAGC
jgi:uncharacterized protein YbjT (DUF2867 family)